MIIDIPKRYEDATIDKVAPDLVEKFSNIRDTRKGLYIHGGVGTGKTHTAYALYRQWEEQRAAEIEKEREEISKKLSESSNSISPVVIKPRPVAEFWNMTRLLYELRKEMRKSSDESLSDNLILHKNLLFIDDLGAEKVTEWVEEVVYLIINTRYENNIPIVITSNYPLSKIAELVGDRVASRIKEMCHVVEIKGEDRRLTK
jgi:DNA replication protein DnaC